MAYGDFKDMKRRTASDKILRDKAFNIAKNPKYVNIKKVLLQWYINFLIKNLKEAVLLIIKKIYNQLKNCINQLLKNLKKEKCILHLEIIFGVADLADMQLLSKFNNGFRFLLCVIDIFSKYARVVPLKDKKKY